MTFTKVTNFGIGSTGTVLLQNLDVIGIVTAGFGVSTVDVFTTGVSTFSGITNITNTTDSTSSTTGALIVTGGVGIAGSLNVGGSVSVGGTLTYEDVTNVDSVGIITARSNILVGSGITLSPDGDVFAVGVSSLGTGSDGGVELFHNGVSRLTAASYGVAVNGDILLSDALDHIGDTNTRIRFPAADTVTVETAGSERFRIAADGKIGIGTDNPVRPLHILDADCRIRLEDVGISTDVELQNSSGDAILTTNGASNIRLQTNNAERLRIDSTGRIGIAGANYGTDNQALTSQGSSSAVEWRGINTPMWDSYQTSATSIPTGSWTLVGGLSETHDSNGAFASSAFTVPAGGAGTYFVYGLLTIDDIQSADYIIVGIAKKASGESSYGDPSVANRGFMNTAGSANARIGSSVNTIMTLAVGDSLRLTCLHNEGSTEPTEPTYTRFGGYRLSI